MFEGKKREGGFTLIEIMIVVLILSVLAFVVVPKVMDDPDEARQVKAKMEIAAFETALKRYKLDNGDYPSTEQGLRALVEPPAVGRLAPKWREGGYLEKGKIPKDPWGYDYVYLSPGANYDFDLSCYGKDGEPGGEGFDRDINNWELE